MKMIAEIASLPQWVDRAIGPSEWIVVTQRMIDEFADVTGDRQWIHCDPERARQEMPNGKTIAHGYLTLSLLPRLQQSLFEIRGATQTINCGANRLRFIAPVPVESRVCLRQIIKNVESVRGGYRTTVESTIEIENEMKPALFMEAIGLLIV